MKGGGYLCNDGREAGEKVLLVRPTQQRPLRGARERVYGQKDQDRDRLDQQEGVRGVQLIVEMHDPFEVGPCSGVQERVLRLDSKVTRRERDRAQLETSLEHVQDQALQVLDLPSTSDATTA